jgi:hypothetical protein
MCSGWTLFDDLTTLLRLDLLVNSVPYVTKRHSILLNMSRSSLSESQVDEWVCITSETAIIKPS